MFPFAHPSPTGTSGFTTGVLDGLGPAVAWSAFRYLLTAYVGNPKYTLATGVSSWLDQSGNGLDMNQGTGGAQPLIAAAGPSSRDSLVFDGSDDILVGAALSSFISASAGYMIMSFVPITITYSNLQPYDNHIIIGDHDGYAGIFVKETGTPDTAIVYNYDGTNDVAISQTINVGSAYVVEWRHETGNVYIRVNAGSWSAATASGNTASLIGLMRMGGRGFGFMANVNLFEGATWTSVPSSGDQDTIAADFVQAIGA